MSMSDSKISCTSDSPDNGKERQSHCSTTVTVTDPMGLHLRTGKDLVQVASQFDAQITAQNLSRNSGKVDAKSILQLMQLQARKDHVLLICANGSDAQDALVALASLF
jgi:phosphotransferase system HPr (HPr) family protein